MKRELHVFAPVPASPQCYILMVRFLTCGGKPNDNVYLFQEC